MPVADELTVTRPVLLSVSKSDFRVVEADDYECEAAEAEMRTVFPNLSESLIAAGAEELVAGGLKTSLTWVNETGGRQAVVEFEMAAIEALHRAALPARLVERSKYAAARIRWRRAATRVSRVRSRPRFARRACATRRVGRSRSARSPLRDGDSEPPPRRPPLRFIDGARRASDVCEGASAFVGLIDSASSDGGASR